MMGLEMRPEHRLQSVHEFFAETLPLKPSPVSPLPEKPPNVGLLILAGQFEGNFIPLSKEPLILGRDPARASLVFSDALISGQHCQVTIVDHTVYIKDLNSSNGTWVNDSIRLRHQETRILRCSDTISLAGCLVLQLVEALGQQDVVNGPEQEDMPLPYRLKSEFFVKRFSTLLCRIFKFLIRKKP
jgi:hypothetical protein